MVVVRSLWLLASLLPGSKLSMNRNKWRRVVRPLLKPPKRLLPPLPKVSAFGLKSAYLTIEKGKQRLNLNWLNSPLSKSPTRKFASLDQTASLALLLPRLQTAPATANVLLLGRVSATVQSLPCMTSGIGSSGSP